MRLIIPEMLLFSFLLPRIIRLIVMYLLSNRHAVSCLYLTNLRRKFLEDKRVHRTHERNANAHAVTFTRDTRDFLLEPPDQPLLSPLENSSPRSADRRTISLRGQFEPRLRLFPYCCFVLRTILAFVFPR